MVERKLSVLVLFLGLVLAGCGGGNESAIGQGWTADILECSYEDKPPSKFRPDVVEWRTNYAIVRIVNTGGQQTAAL